MEQRPTNPFRGLTPYRKEDREWLFGRDKDLVLVQSRIYSGRTTLLFAGSGVGKTSFLNAKVIPNLEEQFAIFYHSGWSGGVEPLAAIQQTINDTINEKYRELGSTSVATLPGKKRPSPLIAALETFNSPAATEAKPNGCLLILDQFEELFPYHSYEEYFKPFLKALCDLVNDRTFPVRIVFSMREEFLGELSVFDNRIPDLFNNYYRLKYPDQRGARHIINRTCQRVNVAVDPDNLTRLVKDLSKIGKGVTGAMKPTTMGQNGSLRFIEREIVAPPYLQIACQKLWQRQFESTGSSAEAGAAFLSDYQPDDARMMLREFVAEKLSALSPAEQELASRSFDFLVTRQGAKMAYELSQLATHMKVDEEELEQALQKLSAPETRILRESGEKGDHWFELYHDMYGTIVDNWREDYRRRQQEETQRREKEQHRSQRRRLRRAAVGSALLTLILVVIVGVPFFILRLREGWRIREESAATLETLAREFEAQEDRDTALVARLGAVRAISGLNAEAEQRNRVEISRLISDDYPLLLATYRQDDMNSISNTMFSADGQVVMTQGRDGAIGLWETQTAKPVDVPLSWSVSFASLLNSDDKPKAENRSANPPANAQDLDEVIKRVENLGYRLRGYEELRSPQLNKTRPTTTSISAVVKHPKYQFLIAAKSRRRLPVMSYEIYWDVKEAEENLFIWRADTGQLLGAPIPLANPPATDQFRIAFSPDGNFIAATGRNNPLVWRIADDKVEPLASIKLGRQPTALVFSPDSKYLCTTGTTTTLWDLGTGRAVWKVAHSHEIEEASFSPDGSRLLTLFGYTITVWNAATGQKAGPEIITPPTLNQFRPHFAADNQTVISDGWGNSLLFWDSSTGNQRNELWWVRGSIDHRIDPKGSSVLTLSDGVARLWSLTRQKPDRNFIRVTEELAEVALSPDGAKLIATTSDRRALVFDAGNGQPTGFALKKAVLSSSGSHLLSANEGEYGNIHVWDIATQREIARFPFVDGVDGFDLSPDGRFLYVKLKPKGYLVLKINDDGSCELLSKTKSANNTDLVFSPNSQYLAALVRVKGSESLTVFELPSMTETFLVAGFLPPDDASSSVFSDDGKLIVELAGNQAVIWQLPSGHALHTLAYSSPITASRFNADGRHFLVGYRDGLVIVWDTATAARLAEIKLGTEIRQIELNGAGKCFVATRLWVHYLFWNDNKLTPKLTSIASRLHDADWAMPFRFPEGRGRAKVRFLSQVESSLLKIQDIDFPAEDKEQAITGDPQQLLDSWDKRLNRRTSIDPRIRTVLESYLPNYYRLF